MPPPPPPPKPGVIPLVPLGVGDILGGTFSAMGRHWKQLFGIALLAYCGVLAVAAGALAVAYSATAGILDRIFDSGPYDDRLASGDTTTLIVAFSAVWIVMLLAMALATAIIQAACPVILQDAVLGRRSTIGVVWRRAWPRVPAVIGALLLPWFAALVVGGLFMAGYVFMIVSFVSGDTSAVWAVLGFVLMLALAPVGVWLWVRYSLAPAAVVFEGHGPVAALRRSAQLVKGSWWRIFGISLLAYLIATVTSYFIQLPFTVIGALSSMPGMADVGPEPDVTEMLTAMGSYLIFIMLGTIISQIIAATFPQLVTGLLYVDQRMRKENLGPALAEAATAPQ